MQKTTKRKGETQAQAADLIRQVAEAIMAFAGEKLRDNTWVAVEEVASGSWGIGGKAFARKDVRVPTRKAGARPGTYRALK